jgi:sugar phosphate isomerase/epimerase
MRIQVSSSLFPGPAENAVKKLVELGFGGIQLGAAHGSADIAQLKDLKKYYSLDYSMHAPFPNKRHDIVDPAKKSGSHSGEVLDSIENAVVLGADIVVVHAGHSSGSFTKSLEINAADFRIYGEYAKERGVEVLFENNDMTDTTLGGLTDSPDMVRRMHDETGLRMCFDTSHLRTIVDTDEEVLDYLERFLPFIGCIHLVDFVFKGRKKVKDHVMPGMGKLDITRFLDITKRYKGPVVYEPYSCDAEQIVAYHKKLVPMH